MNKRSFLLASLMATLSFGALAQTYPAKPVPDFIRDMLPAFADGRIKPIVDRVFPFEQLGAAREHMQANRHLGKIVLAIHPTGA